MKAYKVTPDLELSEVGIKEILTNDLVLNDGSKVKKRTTGFNVPQYFESEQEAKEFLKEQILPRIEDLEGDIVANEEECEELDKNIAKLIAETQSKKREIRSLKSKLPK